MKKMITLMLLVLLTGCTCEYDLEISNNSFKENINVFINDEEISTDPLYENEEIIEADDKLSPFISNDIYSLLSEDKYYKKQIKKYDNITEVNLKYNYNEKNFRDAYLLNNCFENFYFSSTDIYEIKAYGRFNCLNSGNLDIRIKTNNKVVANNADEVIDNVYIWHINTDNEDNTNIEFKLEKGISYKSIITYTLFGIIIIGILIVIYVIYRKNKNNNAF